VLSRARMIGLLASALVPVMTAAAQAGKDTEATTLVYMASQDWVKPAEFELGKKFEHETGIRMYYQIIPADQYQKLLRVKLYTSEMPDLFGYQSGKFDIVNILDIEKNGVDLSGEEWTRRADPLALEQVSVGGKVYGFPLMDISGAWMIVYNKRIFERLGLAVPTTYSQFKGLCAKIRKAGVTPVYECLSDGWHHALWFPELGGRFEQLAPGLSDKLNANESTFAKNKNMLTALRQVKELVELGYFGEDYASNAYADTEKNMASGKYAMTIGSLSLPSKIEASFPGSRRSDFGFFVIPLADNQVLNVNPAMPTKFIYSKSKHVAAARKYIAFLARPENLQYLIDNQADFMTLPYAGVRSKYSPDIQSVFDRYPNRGTVYQTQVKYLNPQWMDMGKDIASMLANIESPEDVLANIDRRREAMARAADDPAWRK
jgi:raffinose/stachyose/melibiose transport system substrate-binding protein